LPGWPEHAGDPGGSVILAAHVSLAMLAGMLFLGRGLHIWQGRRIESLLWRRIVPDSIDSMLLLSGLTMVLLHGWNPLAHAWLAVKLTAVLAYIALGFVALRPGVSPWLRRTSFVAALMIFGYIVAVAYFKSPLF